MATPQGNGFHTPARQLTGMGLQHLGINPRIANPKCSRPAVGDQVQGANGLPVLALLLLAPADPSQGMLLGRASQHQQLRPCHQGLDLRAVEIGDEQMVEHLSLDGVHGEAGELHDAAEKQ